MRDLWEQWLLQITGSLVSMDIQQALAKHIGHWWALICIKSISSNRCSINNQALAVLSLRKGSIMKATMFRNPLSILLVVLTFFVLIDAVLNVYTGYRPSNFGYLVLIGFVVLVVRFALTLFCAGVTVVSIFKRKLELAFTVWWIFLT